jgi:hypothetical protein
MRVLALVIVAGCGRLDFAPRPDARRDAPPDLPAELIVTVDPATHHLGDNSGGNPAAPEGTDMMATFAMTVSCASATLELDFIGPWGPNMNDEPTLTLDGSDLGHVFPQLPPFSDPLWADGDLDGSFDFHIVLSCMPQVGSNAFHVRDNNIADDLFFTNVVVRCEQPR